MKTNAGQLLPPETDADFEALCLDVIREVLKDSGAQAHGRGGQKQHGIDLLARDKDAPVGVQCKHKDLRADANRDPKKLRATLIAELREEAAKAKEHKTTLKRFIFATSAPTDTAVQAEAEQLRAEYEGAGLFAVEVWFWEKICQEISSNSVLQSRILRKFYRSLVDAAQAGPQSFEELLPALGGYLEKLADDCRLVPLLAIDRKAGDVTGPAAPELAKVYVHLNTTEPVMRPATRAEHRRVAQLDLSKGFAMEGRMEPLPALEALLSAGSTVFLGGPGSGKSTLFRYLAFCLANHHLDPGGAWLTNLPGEGWKASQPAPVWVELRRFAASFQGAPPAEGHSDHLWDFVAGGLKKRNLESAIPVLRAALETGRALVLLDGLDEVPDGLRGFVREAIESFATNGFKKSRMVATCRVKSYVPRGLQLKGFKDFTLAEFTEEQSRQFVKLWYDESARKGRMSAEDAAQCVPSLVNALSNPHLAEMARNPMHLTAMACLHTASAGQPLPEESAKLYDQLVNTMLFLWDRAKIKGAGEAEARDELGSLLQQAQCSPDRLREALERLAFQAHKGAAAKQNGDWQAAQITQDQLKIELQKLHPDENGKWAGQVIQAIRHRAGLLQSENDETFQFTFRFQEFLAGAHLANEDAWEDRCGGPSDAGFAKRAAALFDEAGYWRNVILWAAGIKAHIHTGQKRDVRDLIDELCDPVGSVAFVRRRLAFAADIAREARVRALLELRYGRETVQKLRSGLRAWVERTAEGGFPLKERAELASQLGWVGDPREGVGTRPRLSTTDVPDIAWARVIEPGDFIMGGKESWAGGRRFTHRTEHPFAVAAYPATVAQYELFIQDGGYANKFYKDNPAKRIWTDAGWDWCARRRVTRPEAYASVFQTPNHPQTGVSWYEAVAFCNWLNAAFSAEELNLPDASWKVRLPAESEWERAARHSDGRVFPWGNEEQGIENRCNIEGAGLGHTSAAGLFPDGKAVCGAHDMAGNVLEWGLTQWRGDYQGYEKEASQNADGDSARVLRGGWWDLDTVTACCAFRFGYNSNLRDDHFGFRPLVSPFSAL